MAARAREREAVALSLKRAGWTYREIGQRLGVSRSRACHIVQRALDRLVREPAEELIALELLRLDALQMAVWGKAMAGNSQAIRDCLAIMERRARLLGLDRPAQVAADVTTRATPTPAVVGAGALRDDLEARRVRRNRR